MASEPITFLASIPPLMSAVQVAGDGGLRLKLDVPDSEIDILGALLAMRGATLKVTVEIERSTRKHNESQAGSTF